MSNREQQETSAPAPDTANTATDKGPKRNELRELLVTLVMAAVIALVIRQFIMEVRRIPSGSMEPTIMPNDRVVTDKIGWHLYGLQRGMIVVFDPPFPSPDAYIKRLIGLPGDTVAIHDGHVFVNGAALTEPYLEAPPAYVYGPTKVPAGHLFFLGDNRNQSNDSHFWGFADIHKVYGVAWVRMWPLDRLGTFHTPAYPGVRAAAR